FTEFASPFTNGAPHSLGDPQRSLTVEAGVHGTPVKGLFYDASLFWTDQKNRVEYLAFPQAPLDPIPTNMGEARTEGFEGEIAYDFLAAGGGPRHLTGFANLTLLDARFVASPIPGQSGKIPAFAPPVLAKAGLTWREDGRYSLSLSGVSVASSYFQ